MSDKEQNNSELNNSELNNSFNESNNNESNNNESNNNESKPDFMVIVKQYIKLLQVKMNKDDMVFLRKYHYDEYFKNMSDFVPEFKDSYPSLFQMIISGADLSMLDLFFEKFNNIDEGKQTLNDARNDLGNILHDKYVRGQTKY